MREAGFGARQGRSSRFISPVIHIRIAYGRRRFHGFNKHDKKFNFLYSINRRRSQTSRVVFREIFGKTAAASLLCFDFPRKSIIDREKSPVIYTDGDSFGNEKKASLSVVGLFERRLLGTGKLHCGWKYVTVDL